MQGTNLFIRSSNHSHTLTQRWHSFQEQFGVQYLARGHFDMWTGGATNLPITGQPAEMFSGGFLAYYFLLACINVT